ncbi:MAG: hypothetical protein B6D36_11385 [Planctomycetes bacterium UTPLA1]|nr:MAG: hypothetical protein B6D36_11385 [Planctomycetes bacterium UTPLA1]
MSRKDQIAGSMAIFLWDGSRACEETAVPYESSSRGTVGARSELAHVLCTRKTPFARFDLACYLVIR